MNLTPIERLNAHRTLQDAGITGSDLTTSLRGVRLLAGDIQYDAWINTIRRQPHDQLLAQYGHDWTRAVAALRSAATDDESKR
jgi:hypothetical protein